MREYYEAIRDYTAALSFKGCDQAKCYFARAYYHWSISALVCEEAACPKLQPPSTTESKKAISDCTKAIALQPDRKEAFEIRGRSLAATNRLAEAKADYRRAKALTAKAK